MLRKARWQKRVQAWMHAPQFTKKAFNSKNTYVECSENSVSLHSLDTLFPLLRVRQLSQDRKLEVSIFPFQINSDGSLENDGQILDIVLLMDKVNIFGGRVVRHPDGKVLYGTCKKVSSQEIFFMNQLLEQVWEMQDFSNSVLRQALLDHLEDFDDSPEEDLDILTGIDGLED